jgi:hypothetical protein
VEFLVDRVALRQVFSEYVGFSCQFSFHRLLHTYRLSSGAGTIGQLVADVPSGLSLTPPQETKKKYYCCVIVAADLESYFGSDSEKYRSRCWLE